MEVVIEPKEFRVYGLSDKPLYVAQVGDDHVVIAAPEEVFKGRIGEIVGKEVPVGIVTPKGELAFAGRFTAVEEGACEDETDLVLIIEPSDESTETLVKLKEDFAKRYRFPAQSAEGLDPRLATAPSDEVLDDIAKKETGRAGRLSENSPADGRLVARALAVQMALNYSDLEASGVDVIKVREFRREFLLKHLFVPLYESDGYTKVAVVWELAPEAVAAVERSYGDKVTYSVAPEEQVYSAIEHAFNISENRRRAARMGVALRVRFGMFDTSWNLVAGPVQGVTRNISASGLLAACPPLQKEAERTLGNRVGVLLFLPEYEKPLKAVGRIVRASELSNDPPVHLYAVEINHVSDDDRRKLDVFRYTLMWGPHRLKVD